MLSSSIFIKPLPYLLLSTNMVQILTRQYLEIKYQTDLFTVGLLDHVQCIYIKVPIFYKILYM